MECAACGNENPPRSRFCNRCGARQDVPRIQGDRSGEPAAVPSEYRHLTVLFCDLVGSTELSERIDPEELRELMRIYQHECREAVGAYEGFISQYLGDGVLAFFGFPQAHEDDAERAVRAALELQRRLEEKLEPWNAQVRTGIHSGEVIVGEMGHETLAHGSAMNLAARIQSIAEPGCIAISGDTLALVSGMFATRELGEQRLKGFQKPVFIYAVDRVVGGRRHRRIPMQPLVGRERELGLLTEHFALAAGGSGQVIFVSGEAGLGKSRLTVALRDEIRTLPNIWIEMHCSPFSSGSALYPVIDLLDERMPRGQDDAELAADLARGLETIPELDAQQVVPYLISLLGLPPLEAYPLPDMTPEMQRERIMDALPSIVGALAKDHMVVLQIEDLHWADPSTLEYLDRLVELAPTRALLLLCSARPEFKLPWRHDHVHALELARLSHGDALELIHDVAGEDALPAPVVDQIAERTDGVPLYIEELARAMLDSGHRAPQSQLVVPSTLQGSLMERLDRLGSAKRVAQLGATLGHEFSRELIDTVSEIDPWELESGIAQLVEAKILEEIRTESSRSYRFRHMLLRDTAYGSQLRAKRRRIHARIAEVLESDFAERCATEPWVLAQHCEAAGQHARAASGYQAAAGLAAARYANAEALGHASAALREVSETPEGEDRWELELATRLAMVAPLVAMRGFADDEVRALHDRISALCEQSLDGPRAIPGLLSLARYHQRRGDPRQAALVGEEIQAIAQGADIPMLEVVAGLIIGASKITIAESPRAIATIERAVELGSSIDLPPATSSQEPELLSFILAVAGVALASGGFPDRAAARAHEARKRAVEQDHEPTVIHVMAISTVTFYMLEDYETTIRWAQEVLERCGDRGLHGPEAEARTNLGWARVALGDLKGLEDVEAGLARATESGFRGGICEYLQAAADANRMAGHTQRAHDLLDRSQEEYQISGEAICFEGRGRRVRGMTFLAEGARDQAEAELHRALDMLGHYGARLECLMAATELLRLARGRPDESEARERLVRFYAPFETEHPFRSVRAARQLLEETSR
jgi:class 3 adenylate cyclase